MKIPHALREAAAGFARAPLLTGLSAAMVALALFVVGLFAVAAFNLRLALDSVEERVQIVAYLEDETTTVEVARALEELRSEPGVRDVRLVTKDEALRTAREQLPEFSAVFGEIETNPLPASIEIELEEGQRTEDRLVEVAHQAELYRFVEDVRFGEEWVEKLFLIRRIGAATTGLLGGAFAVVAALIIGTAIRIAIFARRDEIHIMRLVGARDSFIRRPFVLEGAITGAAGGLLAALLTFLAYRAVRGFLFELAWIPATWVLLGVLLGAGFGLFASLLAIGRYLREV